MITVDERGILIDLMMAAAAKSPETFADRFNAVAIAGTPRFSAIAADVGDRATALQAAVIRAIDGNFYLALLSEMNRFLPQNAKSQSSLPDTLSHQLTEAEHHAVFDDSGMWDVGWSEAVSKIAPSIGVIRVPALPQPFVGTGLLVGSRLLLTAAHVVESLVDFTQNPPQEIQGSVGDVQVEFHHPRVVDRDLRPVIAKFDETGWLRVSSPPCGKPPQLQINDALANTNLDFALIRLATPVGNVIGPVSIAAPPAANDNRLVAIAGHLGGPSLKFHLGKIIKNNRPARRLHHQANAAPGLSGGPCFDIKGAVLGIHEGAVLVNKKAEYNRSVSLRDIRQVIASQQPDPLLDDPNYVTWLPRNVSLVPLNELGITEDEAERHPLVGRHAFQDWMASTSAAPSNDTRRMALVSGEPSSGKTLTGAIIKAQADRRGDLFHSVSPAAARKTDIPELLHQMATGAATNPPGTQLPGLRPDAGRLRHEVIPDGLAAIEQSLKQRPKGTLFWLFVDFGTDQGWSSSEEDDWKSFFSMALERPWVRIVVAGLSEGRQAEFQALFSQSTALYCETLSRLDWPEIEQLASGMLGTRIRPEHKTDTLRKMRLGWERKVLNASPQERMRTAVEVLLFLLLKTALES